MTGIAPESPFIASAKTLGLELSHCDQYLEAAGGPAKTIGVNDRRVIFGLGPPTAALIEGAEPAPNAFEATFAARIASRGKLPRQYLVIGHEEDRSFTCIDTHDGSIHAWEAWRDAVLADGFGEYFRALREEVEHFDQGLETLRSHIERFGESYGYDRKGSGRLAPDRTWRPYRSCVQDVIVGATAVRYQPAGNLLEVDAFLTAEIPELEAHTGARGLAIFLLGEAVRCGTTMEIRFTSNVEGGTVPLALRALAESVRVHVGDVRADAIAPKESSELSLRLAGYGATRGTRAEALIRNGQLRPEQIAYAVHEGSWTPAELEILMLSPDPLQLLVGPSPWQRLACATGEVYARGAVLLGHLLRSLATPGPNADDDASVSEAQGSEETEDRTIPLKTDVDAAGLAASVQAVREGDTFSVPWRADGDRLDTSRLYVALRPLGVVAMEHQLFEEIDECAERLDTPRAVLVPHDFWLLSAEARRALSDRANDRDVMILVGENRLDDIDIDVQRRQKRVGSRLQP